MTKSAATMSAWWVHEDRSRGGVTRWGHEVGSRGGVTRLDLVVEAEVLVGVVLLLQFLDHLHHCERGGHEVVTRWSRGSVTRRHPSIIRDLVWTGALLNHTTLVSQPSTMNPQPSTLNPQPSAPTASELK